MSKQPAKRKERPEESVWRERLSRFSLSGQTVAAFCRDEGIPSWSFRRWRKLLGAAEPRTNPPRKTDGGTFIDLGSMPMARAGSAISTQSASDAVTACVELRVDLGGGVVVTIARR